MTCTRQAEARLIAAFVATASLLPWAPAAWPAEASGRIEAFSFDSAALDGPVAVTVFRPDGAPPPAGWPVLYLLHGLGGNETDWEKLGRIGDTLDEMIRAGEIAPLLVVMPAAGSGWYVDSAAIAGPGDYQTALAVELPAWVERMFDVRSDAGGRAVAGLSMGGYGALRFALAHPDRFAAAASLSGAIWQNVPPEDFGLSPDHLKLIADSDFFHRVDADTVVAGRDLPPPGSHFSGAFGAPFDPEFFNRQNVFTMLETRIEDGAALPAIYLTVGDDDSHKLWRGAIALYETFQADGRKAELRVTDGDHVWSLWRVSIVDALKFVDSHLTAPPGD